MLSSRAKFTSTPPQDFAFSLGGIEFISNWPGSDVDFSLLFLEVALATTDVDGKTE